jgi:hypothetical protein
VVRRKDHRTLHDRSYPFFYNPMWQLIAGSPAGSPQGTYYKRLLKPVCFDWFMIDQLLIRPNLLSHFADSDVSILTLDSPGSGISLVSREGIPRGEEFSDHLPILCTLNV